MPTDPTILEILSLSDPITILEVIFFLLLFGFLVLAAYMHGDEPPRK